MEDRKSMNDHDFRLSSLNGVEAMELEVPKELSILKWYRISCKLTNLRSVPAMNSPTVSVFQAIVKDVRKAAFPNAAQDDDYPIIFHVNGMRQSHKAHEGEIFPLEIFLFRTDPAGADSFAKAFSSYFADPENGKNYSLTEINEVEERSLEKLFSEIAPLKTPGELCLDFMMPVPFKPEKAGNRTFIGSAGFAELLTKRFSRLFGEKITFDGKTDAFSVLPIYWKYTELKRRSVSQPGSTQYINGCAGKLYLKGDLKEILPYVILGSEIHAGTKFSNSQGYYRILDPSPGYFTSFFPDKKTLHTILREVHERYDSHSHVDSDSDAHIVSEDEYVGELFKELSTNAFAPSPNIAFRIEKKDGSERTIEQLHLRDLVVHNYLLRTLQDALERTFEEGSIGYRKGMSREKSVAMVNAALKEGYRFVIESDISDFFTSVNLEHLFSLIDRYVPGGDSLLKDLLKKVLLNGYVLNGKYFEREKGLAQGSPLSPLLANLYLDSFDEEVQKWDVRLIRYADDFIILTKTKEEAESILSKTETVLSKLGLSLSRKKTSVKSISEGFEFLGIRFSGNEAEVGPEEELIRLRKPLYITEPLVFLSMNGDAVDVYKERKVIETIPLRRISEIMVMEKASFSTALLTRCTEMNIPFTITLGSGYYMTTIKPDSKKYYDLTFQHTRRYYSLSDTEVTAIAKEFASRKIAHYASLFRQRYIAGQNEIIKELDEATSKINRAAGIDEVRGLEGSITKKIYQNINSFIDEELFRIKKRDREHPDRINSLMNFAHYLTFSRINATVRSVGLNPYLGFLHAPEDSYESLVADIQELFRANIERFIIRVVNLKVIKKEDFVETARGMYLTHDAAKKFIEKFEYEMERKGGAGAHTLSDSIYAQVHVIRKWVLEQGSLVFYNWVV